MIMINHEVFVYCQYLMILCFVSQSSPAGVRSMPQLSRGWLGLSLSPELGFGGKFRKLVTQCPGLVSLEHPMSVSWHSEVRGKSHQTLQTLTCFITCAVKYAGGILTRLFDAERSDLRRLDILPNNVIAIKNICFDKFLILTVTFKSCLKLRWRMIDICPIRSESLVKHGGNTSAVQCKIEWITRYPRKRLIGAEKLAMQCVGLV